MLIVINLLGGGDRNGDKAPADPGETIVIDIDLNDEVLSEHSLLVESKIDDICRKGELNWDNYIRTPFKHQDVGVRWILGLVKPLWRFLLLSIIIRKLPMLKKLKNQF